MTITGCGGLGFKIEVQVDRIGTSLQQLGKKQRGGGGGAEGGLWT